MNQKSFSEDHPYIMSAIVAIMVTVGIVMAILIFDSGRHKLTPEKPFIEGLSVEKHRKLLLGMSVQAEHYRYFVEEYNKVLEASSPQVRGDLKKIEVK